MPKTIIKPSLPVINRASPLAKGLVACYPFFERGGTTLRDISGKNNHGTLTNMNPATDWVKTPRGYGLDFGGVITEKVSCVENGSLDFTTFVSFEAWIKPTNTISYRTIIDKSVDPGYHVLLAPGNTIGVRVVGITWQESTGVTVPINVWTHLVVTYDGSNIRFCLDGVLRKTNPQTGAMSTNNCNLTIGRYSTSNDYPFLGTIDEVRIWNRVLSASEVATLYANPNCIYYQPKVFSFGKAPSILEHSYATEGFNLFAGN